MPNVRDAVASWNAIERLRRNPEVKVNAHAAHAIRRLRSLLKPTVDRYQEAAKLTPAEQTYLRHEEALMGKHVATDTDGRVLMSGDRPMMLDRSAYEQELALLRTKYPEAMKARAERERRCEDLLQEPFRPPSDGVAPNVKAVLDAYGPVLPFSEYDDLLGALDRE